MVALLPEFKSLANCGVGSLCLKPRKLSYRKDDRTNGTMHPIYGCRCTLYMGALKIFGSP